MEPAAKKRKGYPTHAQKTRLIQLLQADDNLRSGKFSATFTKKTAEARWTALALELNSIPGAKKDWSEWRRTWQDMKSKAKKKESAVRRCYNETGGGSPADNSSGDDIIILNTISKSELEGHSDVEEAVVVKYLPWSSKMLIPDLPGSNKMLVQDLQKSNKILVPGVPGSSKMLVPDFVQDLQKSNKILVPGVPGSSKMLVPDFTLPPTTITDPLGEVTKCNISKEETIPKTIIMPDIIQNNNDGFNKENIDKKKTSKRNTIGNKIIETFTSLKEILEDKNKYKKIFYENYIIEMRRQTDALLLIANNIKKE